MGVVAAEEDGDRVRFCESRLMEFEHGRELAHPVPVRHDPHVLRLTDPHPNADVHERRVARDAKLLHSRLGERGKFREPLRIDGEAILRVPPLDLPAADAVFDALERLTPEVCFPETSEGWPASFYHSPIDSRQISDVLGRPPEKSFFRRSPLVHNCASGAV